MNRPSREPSTQNSRAPRGGRPAGPAGPAAAPGTLVVFELISDDSKCDACGQEMDRGEILAREGNAGRCLPCADLDHLIYLPRGDAALTRRSTKYSALAAVVVRWSRRRKRYERQATLVEEAALARAEAECLADADARELRRGRDAVRREKLDSAFVSSFAACVRDRFPRAPADAAVTIAEHACLKGSGRVGRTAAAKEFSPETVDLAVRAHIRHVHTKYDEFLAQGIARDEARQRVGGQVDEISRRWKG